MTVRIEKPAINVREELADLRKPSGTAGEAMLRAETPQEQFNLIGAGRRNLIINGDMRIAQRGASATSVSNNSNTYVLDRFFARINGSNGAATVAQVSDSPDIFSNSLKFTVTTADTSLDSGHYTRVNQEIEGYNISGLGWGTSSAKPVTLSFWVKGSVPGIYSVGIYNGVADRSFIQEYTINSSNVWEYKTITIVGPTDGTWAIDNSAELRPSFSLGTGSSYNTDGIGYWRNAFSFGSSNNVNLMATVGATFQITGVQLEAGKVATPFEHRSYGEELAACQRYFEIMSTGVIDSWISTQTQWTATQSYGGFNYMVPKRATPSVSVSASSHFKYYSGGSNAVPSTVTLQNPTTNGCEIFSTTTASFTIGNAGWLRTESTAAKLIMDAEL